MKKKDTFRKRALKEAKDEAGAKGKLIYPYPFTIVGHQRGSSSDWHKIAVFLYEVNVDKKRAKEKRKPGWCSYEKAKKKLRKNRTTEGAKELLLVLEKAQRLLSHT